MKREILSITTFVIILLSLVACNNKETFSQLQEKEEQTIREYIKDNNYQIVTEKPTKWEKNVFYLTPSGLYIHIESIGDTTVSINKDARTKIGYRTLEYQLDKVKTVISDKLNSSDYPDPIIITYGDLSSYNAIGSGMYEALGIMNSKGAKAKLIVPSALNTKTYSYNLIPTCYDVIITVID
jgi:hypothetical protein